MPNPDLDDVLTDRVTRRRLTEALVDGETALTHDDETEIRARVSPASLDFRRRSEGTGLGGDFVVTLDPDTDVRSPSPEGATPRERDVLIVTAGGYAGRVLQVDFVQVRAAIGALKAEATLLPKLPISAPTPAP